MASASDLDCPQCGSPVRRGADASSPRCSGCTAAYDVVLGVPFLGAFERRDMLGLIEIAANAPERAALRLDPEGVTRLDALCAGFHVAEDQAAFRAANPEAQAFYFANRYSEWLAVNALLEGVDLTGRKVLDIGAGQGFDAWRLALRGAEVTALEFSPLLCEAGSLSFPTIRWIGGFGHALPFADAAFDHVFINAALHHMQDIPATIAEALRVLRPGGLLITSGDPFRSVEAGIGLEFDIFDRHEAVLRGINEQIPSIGDIFRTLEENREILEPQLFTDMLYGGPTGNGPDLTQWARWDFDADRAMLKQRAGGLAMRIRLRAAWPHPCRHQRDGVLPAQDFATWLADPATVLSRLAALVPDAHVDAPFPGPPEKFDLLNGWRVAQSTATTRTGFRRARLFLTRGTATTRCFDLRAATPGRIGFLVNGRLVGEAPLETQWRTAAINVTTAPPGGVFLLEFRRLDDAPDFDAGCFDVRRTAALAAWRARAMRRLGRA